MEKIMFKNFRNVIAGAFRSRKEMRVDEALMEGMDVEDNVDEPTAYAVLLMDLARIDGHVSEEERVLIRKTLQELFPGRAKDADILMGAAENVLNSFRGSSMFVAKVKEEYSNEEREKLFAIIEKIIAADNHEDDMEKYLRGKFQALLA
jgi:uncharacterized tellurite resistance protein B-like protein